VDWGKRKDLDEVLARRQELLARSDENREVLARGARGLRKPIAVAVWGYRAANFVKRNPVLVGLGTALVSKLIAGSIFGFFGSGSSKSRKKRKPSRLGSLYTWASRIGTVATVARQMHYYYKQHQKQTQAARPAPTEAE